MFVCFYTPQQDGCHIYTEPHSVAKNAVCRYNKDIKGEKLAGEDLTSEATNLQPGVMTSRLA